MAAGVSQSDSSQATSPELTRQQIDAARAGSSRALGQLFELCSAYLLLVANRELDRDLRAKVGPSDLVQETLLEAERDFEQFHGHSERELLAWLHRLLLNNMADAVRFFRHTAKRSIAREVPLDGAGSADAVGDALVDMNRSPSSSAAVHEEIERVLEAIGRLPEAYRQVITLRHVESRTFAQIARRMNRSVQAVHNLWTRAIVRMQRELGRPS